MKYIELKEVNKKGNRVKIQDLRNQVFGEQTVIEYIEKKNHKTYWKIKCSCGKTKIKSIDNLKITKSCGCVQKAKVTSHGHSKDPTYKTWQMMKQRCHNPKAKDYYKYGEKSITVCPRWYNSYELFLKDMGERPNGMTIDRLDPTKSYCKSNCRWADKYQQNQENRSATKLTKEKVIEIRNLGSKYKAKEIIDILQLNVSRQTIQDVLKYKTWNNI